MSGIASTDSVKIYDSFFENDNADYIFYYTGKSNILGLQHPDHVFKNTKDFKYARIAFIKFIDSGDPDLVTHVNEDLTVAILSDLYKPDDIQYNSVIHVKLMASAKNCRVITSSVYVYEDFYGEGFEIIATEDAYQDTDGKVKYGLSLWVSEDISDMNYICTAVNYSLATDTAPVNGDSFYPADYNIEYLNDSNVISGENVSNATPKGIGHLINRFDKIDKKLDEIVETESHFRSEYIQNTAVYDVQFKPDTTEKNITPTSLKRSTVGDDIMYIDNINKDLIINDDGIYSIQLRNGFYLIKGTSRVDLNVYIGGEVVSELGISMYLTSNGEEDARKAIKNTLVSPAYVAKIDANKHIRVTARWTNIDGIVVENETMLMVTKLRNTESSYYPK